MSRARLLVVALAVVGALLAVDAGAAPDAGGFVKRIGNKLYLNGAPYTFTGLNIYNANSRGQCWYDMVGGSTLDDSLTAIGSGKEAFRAWFFQSLATKNGARDWTGFDHTLAVARAHGVKVIVTLTNQWGDCEDGTFKTDAWYRTGYRQRDPAGTVSYRSFVKQVVRRYKKNKTILAWQLVNEAEVKPSRDGACSPDAAAVLKAFAADVSGLVKATDRNHLVSLGTMGGGQCGAAGAEYQDVHSVPTIDLCEYHDYGEPNVPMPGDEWNGLQVRIDQCNALDKPIFVGEVGIRPSDVPGGSYDDRANAFDAKFDAQLSAGVVGMLAWAWSILGSTPDDFDIGPGDPALDVFGAY